jgi:hypothetical protein
MRDPARIDAVLSELRRVWEANPDLRLAQLVVIAARPTQSCPEVFHCEDEALLEGLAKYDALSGRRAS